MKIVPFGDSSFIAAKIRPVFYIDLEKLAGKWYFCSTNLENAFLVFIEEDVVTASPLFPANKMRSDLLDKVEKDGEIESECLGELRGKNPKSWILLTWTTDDKPYIITQYNFRSDYPYSLKSAGPFIFYNTLDDTFYKIITSEGNAPYIYMLANKINYPKSNGYTQVGKFFLEAFLEGIGIPGRFNPNQKIEGSNEELLILDSPVFRNLRNSAQELRKRTLLKNMPAPETKSLPIMINLSDFLLTRRDASASEIINQAAGENVKVEIIVDKENLPSEIVSKLLQVIVNGTHIVFIVNNLGLKLAELRTYFGFGIEFSISIITHLESEE